MQHFLEYWAENLIPFGLQGVLPPRRPPAGVKRSHSGMENGGSEASAGVQRMLQEAARGMGLRPVAGEAAAQGVQLERHLTALGGARGGKDADPARLFVSCCFPPSGKQGCVPSGVLPGGIPCKGAATAGCTVRKSSLPSTAGTAPPTLFSC